MLNLDSGEEILLIMHHHWITLVGPFFIVLFSLIIPWILLPLAVSSSLSSFAMPLFYFFISIWYLIVLMMAFGFWIDYYLDALVITTKRVLDIDQIGLFKHVVSEFRMEKVQDVTIEVPGFAGTFFGFGNIKIQTAGEVSFSIDNVPSPHVARDLILKHAKTEI